MFVGNVRMDETVATDFKDDATVRDNEVALEHSTLDNDVGTVLEAVCEVADTEITEGDRVETC